MNSFLDEIKNTVIKRSESLVKIETRNIKDNFSIRSLVELFKQGETNIIAEIKYASPSKGSFNQLKSPEELAFDYVSNGARALSILTEPHYFGGSDYYFQQVRQALPRMPLLVKDFILDERQVFRARELGANGLLLIVAFLGEKRLKELLKLCQQLKIDPLIEVHNKEELQIALKAGAQIIGLNNRNLKTLNIDLKTSEELLPLIPEDVVVIVESGISKVEEIRHFRELGADGFLIGGSLMQASEPGERLRELL